MIICVDFDGTIVVQDGRLYSDTTTPLRFIPGALEGLNALKAAGHTLILWSARSNRALRENPDLDPLVRSGYKKSHRREWDKHKALHIARYEQMLSFVREKLPNIFAAIDDGSVGKIDADAFIDDKAVRIERGIMGARWLDLVKRFGTRVVING